ncbi:hypothetical protein I5M27_02375 [Adhaeribacter sp. BT258]|uniref:Uncharacterized protein n=1 Tax=Adhaeribacter terrigena TaxID=2793070 RepID=A0ABS1BY34_9BACT|nr:hypothetical protein [Adhaeribacter terrigena]MBK0401811.1 hypothetical protein [Adhaeribacter terrigena]
MKPNLPIEFTDNYTTIKPLKIDYHPLTEQSLLEYLQAILYRFDSEYYEIYECHDHLPYIEFILDEDILNLKFHYSTIPKDTYEKYLTETNSFCLLNSNSRIMAKNLLSINKFKIIDRNHYRILGLIENILFHKYDVEIGHNISHYFNLYSDWLRFTRMEKIKFITFSDN